MSCDQNFVRCWVENGSYRSSDDQLETRSNITTQSSNFSSSCQEPSFPSYAFDGAELDDAEHQEKMNSLWNSTGAILNDIHQSSVFGDRGAKLKKKHLARKPSTEKEEEAVSFQHKERWNNFDYIASKVQPARVTPEPRPIQESSTISPNRGSPTEDVSFKTKTAQAWAEKPVSSSNKVVNRGRGALLIKHPDNMNNLFERIGAPSFRNNNIEDYIKNSSGVLLNDSDESDEESSYNATGSQSLTSTSGKEDAKKKEIGVKVETKSTGAIPKESAKSTDSKSRRTYVPPHRRKEANEQSPSDSESFSSSVSALQTKAAQNSSPKTTVKSPVQKTTVKSPVQKTAVKSPVQKTTVKSPVQKITVKSPLQQEESEDLEDEPELIHFSPKVNKNLSSSGSSVFNLDSPEFVPASNVGKTAIKPVERSSLEVKAEAKKPFFSLFSMNTAKPVLPVGVVARRNPTVLKLVEKLSDCEVEADAKATSNESSYATAEQFTFNETSDENASEPCCKLPAKPPKEEEKVEKSELLESEISVYDKKNLNSGQINAKQLYSKLSALQRERSKSDNEEDFINSPDSCINDVSDSSSVALEFNEEEDTGGYSSGFSDNVMEYTYDVASLPTLDLVTIPGDDGYEDTISAPTYCPQSSYSFDRNWVPLTAKSLKSDRSENQPFSLQIEEFPRL